MAFAVLIVVAISIGAYSILSAPTLPQELPNVEQNPASSTQFARSAPVTLRIPSIKLETSFETPLGLNADGTIEVPGSFEKVGWYKNGATPGEVGTATILGHVDSYQGPAIFWDLGDLKPGDEIEVTREDGSVAVFEIETSERYSQSDFPTEKVYGMTDYQSLRLITCSGTYNHGTQRYSHNLVVYAKLKKT